MKVREENFFHEIAIGSISDSIVILDIDGTLTCSSRCSIDKRVLDVVQVLQENNTVYVFSNNYNGARSRKIAADLNLPYIESPHKKPNRRVLNYIAERGCPVVAIGDKYLTDGLLAQFAQAHHIRVKRYRCKDDSFVDRAACLFDDCVYFFARLLRLTK